MIRLRHRLYTRLATGFVAVVALTGAAVLAWHQLAARDHQLASAQRLNANVAMYVADALAARVHDTALDGAIAELASHAMVVNPAVTVYLLDAQGRVLYPASVDAPTRRVPLGPVQRFVAGAEAPLLGVDPRDPRRQVVFSASPVALPQASAAWVYAVIDTQVLGARPLGDWRNPVTRNAVIGGVALLATGAALGLSLIFLLVRRLGSLQGAMQCFASFHELPPTQPAPRRHGDEIDALWQNFGDMAQTIAAQVRALRQTDERRRELIANVSHDLRTPLTATRGYIETLLTKHHDWTPAERDHALQVAGRGVERAGRLIDDLFELSRLESGGIEARPERFSIVELLFDTLQEFEVDAEQRGVRLYAPPPPETDIQVSADLGLIQRVLENLLRNAVRHTPEGGAVRVACRRDAGSVMIEVADSGVGISDEDLPHIFERYYVARGDSPEARRGTGLGLSIVKRILDLHDSAIEVWSVPALGSSFCFRLQAVG